VLPLFEHRIGTAAMGLHLSALRREAVLLNVRDSAANEQFFRSIFENAQLGITFFNTRRHFDIGVG
jgi:hypothetical protein